MRWRAALVWLMVLPAVALGATEPPVSYVSVQLENDFLASSGDRYYTHGTQFSLLQNTAPPPLLNTIADWVPFYQKGQRLNLVNYTIGQKIFTPDDTEATAIVAHDRPYAGYLYFGAAVLSQIESSTHFDYGNMFEVTLGMIGPSVRGGKMQNGLHDLIGLDSPRGWDNQLHDEAALGLSYLRFWRLVQPVGENLEFGVAPHLGVALGNVYTYGAGGVIVRLGDNLRRDLSPPNIPPGFPGLAYFRVNDEPSWYAYLGFESRLVLRDIFLDGNTFHSSHSVEKEPLVGDVQFGVVWLLRDMRITISNMFRTPEFSTQQVNTHYGAVNFSFLLD